MGRTTKIQTFSERRPYVLWRRVSTRQQGRSELGLDAQLTIAQTFMGREPVETFTDVYSGTKLRECKGLQAAVSLCKEKDYVLVVAKTDRCRNLLQALELLDNIGARNIIFCDVGENADRFILSIFWASWERQAIMGRINTKAALAERKKQRDRDGGWVSKAGNYCTRLGNKPGTITPEAIRAMARKRTEIAEEWKKHSPLYTWLTIQVLKARTDEDILREAAELHEQDPEQYSTRTGQALGRCTYQRWKREILKR